MRSRSLYFLTLLALCAPPACAATAMVHPSFPVTDGAVNALVVSGNTLYVGGTFTHVGGLPRQGVAAIDRTTEQVTPWNPGTNGFVTSIAVQSGVVYVTGGFDHVGGQSRACAAAVDSADGAVLSWSGRPHMPFVTCIEPSPGGVFVGCYQLPYQLQAWGSVSGDSLLWSAYVPHSPAEINALLVRDGHLYVAGDLDSLGVTPYRGGFAMLDPVNGAIQKLYWSYLTNVPGHVYALASTEGTMFLGGDAALRAVDEATGDLLPWSQALVGGARAMAAAPGRVYAGGTFSAAGGQPRQNLAALDASTATPTEWNPGVNGTVNALATAGGTVYAGGSFTTIAGESHAYLGAIDDPPQVLAVTGARPGPAEAVLHAPSPDPFSNSATVRFDLPHAARVSIDLVDVSGRRVAPLVTSQSMAAGHHELTLTHDGLGAGLYWVRLTFDERSIARRVVVLP